MSGVKKARHESPRERKPEVKRIAEQAMRLSRPYLAEYGATRSRKGFTQRQLMTCLVFRAYLRKTCRAALGWRSGCRTSKSSVRAARSGPVGAQPVHRRGASDLPILIMLRLSIAIAGLGRRHRTGSFFFAGWRTAR